jgi:hypothetical protein
MKAFAASMTVAVVVAVCAVALAWSPAQIVTPGAVPAYPVLSSIDSAAVSCPTDTAAHVKLAAGYTAIAIKNPSGNNAAIYLGDSAVSSSDGFPLSAGETFTIDASGWPAQLYCLSAHTSAESVRVIGGQ